MLHNYRTVGNSGLRRRRRRNRNYWPPAHLSIAMKRREQQDGSQLATRAAPQVTSSQDYLKVISLSVSNEPEPPSFYPQGGCNNHNYSYQLLKPNVEKCINLKTVEKKEFMKSISQYDIEWLFKQVKLPAVRQRGGWKDWDLDEFILQKKDRRIFVGGQGFVLFVRRKGHSTSLAMKACLHGDSSGRISRYKEKAELQIRAQSQSIFVSKLLSFYVTETFFVSIMYKAKYASLKVIKREVGCLPPEFIRYFSSCIYTALSCLHRMNICHKDVKADNVLIDYRGIPQLADFGLAMSSSEREKYNINKKVTSMQYYPPESLVNGGELNDFKIDTWLFGFFLAELSITSSQHMWSKLRDSKEAGWSFKICNRCFIPEDTRLRSLLSQLLLRDPRKRPLLENMRKHEYFDKNYLDPIFVPDCLHIQRLIPAYGHGRRIAA